MSRSPQFKFRYSRNGWLIWGSRSGQFEGYCLLERDIVQIVPTNVILNIRRDMELGQIKLCDILDSAAVLPNVTLIDVSDKHF
jgi:hypothetical protein